VAELRDAKKGEFARLRREASVRKPGEEWVGFIKSVEDLHEALVPHLEPLLGAQATIVRFTAPKR
jgi:hypothetical protein